MHIDYKAPIAPWEAVSLPTGCPYCGFCMEWIGRGVFWCVSCGTITLTAVTDGRSRCFRHSPPSSLRRHLRDRGWKWVVAPQHEFCFVDSQKAGEP